jgi:hypothetical protein
MKTQQNLGIQDSKYFTPAFNSAFYDGPFRIYFSQTQESFAVKVLMALKESIPVSDTIETGKPIYILIYPTVDSYELVFGENAVQTSVERGRDSTVVALAPPHEESLLEAVYAQVSNCLKTDLGNLDFQ